MSFRYHCQTSETVGINLISDRLTTVYYLLILYNILQKMPDHKFNYPLNGPTTVTDPSPQDFVFFIPWACRELDIASNVEVTRIQIGTLYRLSVTKNHI